MIFEVFQSTSQTDFDAHQVPNTIEDDYIEI